MNTTAAVIVTDYAKQAKFLDACYRGDLPMVRSMVSLKEVSDINCKYDLNRMQGKVGGGNASFRDGTTPVMIAVNAGRREVVQFLVKQAKASVNETDNEGDSALTLAAQNGQRDLFDFLLTQADADLNQKDNDGRNVLMKAALNGRREIVEYLLRLPRHLVNVDEKASSDGSTALMYASQQGFCEIVDLLLRVGADLNEKNKRGYTAYQLAATERNASFEAKAKIQQLLKQAAEDELIRLQHKKLEPSF